MAVSVYQTSKTKAEIQGLETDENGFSFAKKKTNCKADRTAKKGNNFIAQYFGETKLTSLGAVKAK